MKVDRDKWADEDDDAGMVIVTNFVTHHFYI